MDVVEVEINDISLDEIKKILRCYTNIWKINQNDKGMAYYASVDAITSILGMLLEHAPPEGRDKFYSMIISNSEIKNQMFKDVQEEVTKFLYKNAGDSLDKEMKNIGERVMERAKAAYTQKQSVDTVSDFLETIQREKEAQAATKEKAVLH